MDAARIQVKIYAASAPELERFIPVFHRWIRDKVLDELVIDVADYGHVHDGPGVVLIGHGSDYQADQGDGRFGLVYTRKRDAPAPSERLVDALRRALRAARLLEEEPGFADLHFGTSEMLVRLPDRLRAPNDDAGFAKLRAELEPITKRLYAESDVSIERTGGARDPLGARLVAKNPPASVAELLARLS